MNIRDFWNKYIETLSGETGEYVSNEAAMFDRVLEVTADFVASASSPTVTWDSISGKPAVIAAGADAATARTAIGLGTLATLSTVTSANITDGTIVNADIATAAAIARAKLAAHGVATLTDSSGGTSGGNTVAAIALATAAATGADTATLPTLTSVNASITAIRNDIATLAAKLNSLSAAI